MASPNARRSRSVRDELRIASMYQRPIYPFWIAESEWIDAVPLGWGGVQYLDAREDHYTQAVGDLIMALGTQNSSGQPQVLTPAHLTPPPLQPRNPYKGLRAFQMEDARDFFGRSRLVQELLQAVEHVLATDTPNGARPRLLTLLGPSGSGKSSTVMAGLLPQLQQGALPGSQDSPI